MYLFVYLFYKTDHGLFLCVSVQFKSCIGPLRVESLKLFYQRPIGRVNSVYVFQGKSEFFIVYCPRKRNKIWETNAKSPILTLITSFYNDQTFEKRTLLLRYFIVLQDSLISLLCCVLLVRFLLEGRFPKQYEPRTRIKFSLLPFIYPQYGGETGIPKSK